MLEGNKIMVFSNFNSSCPFGNRDEFREDCKGKEGSIKPLPMYKKAGQ